MNNSGKNIEEGFMKYVFLLLALICIVCTGFSNEKALDNQSGDTVRPEYPRPQFARTEWVNLNGKWTFSTVDGAE